MNDDDPDVPTGFCCVNKSWLVGATVYLDVDLAYQVNDNWRVNVGAINIMDEFVDIVPSSAANYEGGVWYLRGTYSFE